MFFLWSRIILADWINFCSLHYVILDSNEKEMIASVLWVYILSIVHTSDPSEESEQAKVSPP